MFRTRFGSTFVLAAACVAAFAAAGCGGSSQRSKVDAGGGDATGPDGADAASPAPDALDAPAGSDATDALDARDVRDAGDALDGGVDVPGDAGSDVRVAASCTPPQNGVEPPAKLSDTGCVLASNPHALSAAFVPYEVQSPFWSDGATISRAFALPAGTKIHAVSCAAEPDACVYGPADDGKWVFPIGTMVAQSFAFDGKSVETRFLARVDMDNWVGYTYQWDEAQTDATLVPDERLDIQFNTGTRTVGWHFLNRLDCITCHSFAGGNTLGTETAQLNRVVGGSNQLDRLQTMGLFDAPLPTPYKAALVVPYAGPGGTPPASATAEQRVRSYLHGNCSPCHRPGGLYSSLDLRNDVAFIDTHTCGRFPSEGDQGVTGAQIITPTMPMMSVLWLRMNTADPVNGRMPALGSFVIDQDAVTLVGDWITSSVTSCPQ
jgi:hypothetical protein